MMLARSLGVLAFLMGIFQLANNEFLAGMAMSFLGLYLFRSDWHE